MTLPPGSIPPSLAPKIEAVLTEARGELARVPAARRQEVKLLKARLEKANRAWEGSGCGVGVVVLVVANFFFTASEAFFLAIVVALAVHYIGAFVVRSKSLRAMPSHELLDLATKAAGLNETETTAIGLWNAPRADADVRAEIERLLAEDARLVAAGRAISGTDTDPIRAERLKLKLAITKADGDEREALQASLALCERRLQAAKDADALRRRIEAYRGLVLQSLRAAGDGLGRAGAGETPELARIQEASSALLGEAGAIEAAVQEMRTI